MTEQTAPETAPQTAPSPWWAGKFICNTIDAKDPKPDEPKRIASIYKAIGIESGRIVGIYVMLDGTMTTEGRPLRFFPVESLLSTVVDTKPGSRVFTSYDAAKNYAGSVGAKTFEDFAGLTTERLAEVKELLKQGKKAALEFGSETLVVG